MRAPIIALLSAMLIPSFAFAQTQNGYDSTAEIIDETLAPSPGPAPQAEQVKPDSAAPQPEQIQPDSISEFVLQTAAPSAFDTPLKSSLYESQKLAVRGATAYFVGFGVSYLIATPLSFLAVADNNIGLALLALGAGGLATGLQFGGPIRAGVGASMAYDELYQAGIRTDRNINWGFYRAGWVFQAINAAISAVNTLINSAENSGSSSSGVTVSSTPNYTLTFISLGLGIATDAMWMTSTINSLSYTKKAYTKVGGLTGFDVSPYYTWDGKAGVRLSCLF
jgi:hypothetical protein